MYWTSLLRMWNSGVTNWMLVSMSGSDRNLSNARLYERNFWSHKFSSNRSLIAFLFPQSRVASFFLLVIQIILLCEVWLCKLLNLPLSSLQVTIIIDMIGISAQTSLRQERPDCFLEIVRSAFCN